MAVSLAVFRGQKERTHRRMPRFFQTPEETQHMKLIPSFLETPKWWECVRNDIARWRSLYTLSLHVRDTLGRLHLTSASLKSPVPMKR
jgi:hypothetical protein